MGEDKALLPFANFKTLTEYQLNKLQKLFKNVYISCKSKDKFDFNASFIEDVKTSEDIFAPTTGFVAIFKELQEERFFAISVDSPFISDEIIGKIVENDSLHVDATIAKTSFGMQPMCGIYHRSLEDKFLYMLKENNHKLGYLLKSSKTNFIEFEDSQSFLNLNNPDEYKEALTLI